MLRIGLVTRSFSFHFESGVWQSHLFCDHDNHARFHRKSRRGCRDQMYCTDKMAPLWFFRLVKRLLCFLVTNNQSTPKGAIGIEARGRGPIAPQEKD